MAWLVLAVGVAVLLLGLVTGAQLPAVGPWLRAHWRRLAAAVAFGLLVTGGFGLFRLWFFASTTAVAWLALGPFVGGPAREPAHLQQDHAGWTVAITHRSELPGLVLGVFATLLPWPLLGGGLLGAGWLLLRPAQTSTVRVRGGQVEVGVGESRRVLPLFGLRVVHRRGWDGSATLVLDHPTGTATVLAGGHDPGDVAWLYAELSSAAASADPPPPPPEPPPALRELVGRSRRDTEG
ncbi:MAG: hypothetical protein ACI8PZ_006810 [Myxococcota bacterium]|jgi:hypothetical protein